MTNLLRSMVNKFDHADNYFDAITGIQNNQIEIMNMIQEMHSNILQISKGNDEIKEKIKKMKNVEKTEVFKEISPQTQPKKSECK